ncbi:MAG: 5-(carboxyamino)imidazole ribonucleotide synthase [Bacteroidia bacterium]|nr:5-(carboxyamino)imidazole ribonucleotide synthase [Bacteroidia bacterium]
MKKFYKDLKLGIVGGGQLGRMLIQAGIDMNVHIEVLDPNPEAPAKAYAHGFTQGSLTDFDAVYEFGKNMDVITIEIENVNTEALSKLASEGKVINPDPGIIRLIQDKREQKQFFEEMGLPTSPFRLVDNKADVLNMKDFLPAVNKLGKAGYDGRGVQVIKEEADLEKAFDAPGILEKFIPFEKELAVLVARNAQGDTAVYPVVEMSFHPEHNLVEYLFAPASISMNISRDAQEMARSIVEKLSYVGIMAVEMFLTKDGDLLINEMAPRPHNSGHHTIKACFTSQYEQHLRAILALPLGSTLQSSPAALVNLLGEDKHKGPAYFNGIEEIMQIPGAHPHIYGKAETKPFRKMGHVILLDQELESLQKKARQVKNLLKVVAEEKMAT